MITRGKTSDRKKVLRDFLEAIFVAIAVWFVLAEFPFSTLRFVYELY